VIKPAARQLRPGVAQGAGAADPQYDLKVAKAARGLLEIGLEAVRAVLELGVALLLLEPFRLEENPGVHAFRPGAVEAGEEIPAAREQSCLEAGSFITVTSLAASSTHSATVRTL